MEKTWSNTLLVAYSSLQKIANEIDFGIRTRVNSTFQSAHLRYGVTNEQLIDEILKLNDEKRKICNVSYMVNTALSKLSEKEKLVLEERIIKGKTFQVISDEHGIPMRTLFRNFDSAEKRFKVILSQMGFDEKWLESEYSKSKYISKIYERLQDEKYHTVK